MPNIEIKDFTGINNQSDQFNVPLNGMISGSNIEVDNKNRVRRRDGQTLRIAGDFHSVWSDIKRGFTFVVDNANNEIKRVNPGFALTTIVTGLTGKGKMSFVETVRDRIVYSNGIDIGLIDNGVSSSFSLPLESYQTIPVPCKILEWFNARLYMAQDDKLWFTDAFSFYVDKRFNLFQFSSELTMLAAVNDGLYVSDKEYTYFVTNDPASRIKVSGYPAVKNTFQVVDSELLGLEGLTGALAVIWVTEKGINIGGNGGNVINVTRDRYTVPPSLEGKAVVRKTNSDFHYIVNLYN